MNRLSRFALLMTVVWGMLIPVVPLPALADPIGGVLVIPGTGTDLDPLRLRTSTGCPAKANAYYARMHGRDFPSDGQIITSPTKAGLSHSIGFDVYVGLVMREYANENRTTLGGRYDITVYCVDRLTLESYGEFGGSLVFTSPTTYKAIGAAMPVGPPPPPREMDADGAAIDPNRASQPTSAPPVPAPTSGNFQPLPLSAAQVPGADSPIQPGAGQLASQHNDMAAPGTPWPMLILIGALFGAALVGWAVIRQIRRGRSP